MQKRLSKDLIRRTQPDPSRDLFLWDTDVRGLGLKVTPTDRRVWVFQYRRKGKPARRLTLGSYGVLTLDQARKTAADKRLELVRGEDPAARYALRSTTVEELYHDFLASHGPKRAKKTRKMYQQIFEAHLLPAFRDRPVEAITWADIHRLHVEMGKTTPVQANRMLAVVSKAWAYAQRLKIYPQHLLNPGRGHDRHPESRTRGRKLTAEEMARVGAGLALEGEVSVPADAVRVIILTGLRPNEIRTARWEDLSDDGRLLRLKESKTGPRVGYLGRYPAEIVARQERLSDYIFPGQRPEKPYYDNFRTCWERVRVAAELTQETRLYDAGRHTFTSVAQEDLGIARWKVRELIGHSDGSTTGRYTHIADRSLLEDADRISDYLWALLTGTELAGLDSPPEEGLDAPLMAP